MNKEEELFQLINEVKDKLPSHYVKNIIECNQCNERGIAFEDLCEHLYEYEVPISHEFYDKLVSFGKSINVESSYWEDLRELIK